MLPLLPLRYLYVTSNMVLLPLLPHFLESFLEKYPRSLHNTEAHKRLIDAAEKRAVASLSSSKMTEYINIYLIPNSRFLTENELSQKKTTISKAIDLQLIKENIKRDLKKYSVAGIIPEILDLKYLYVEYDSSVYYNVNSAPSSDYLKTIVSQNINSYTNSTI